MQQVVTKARQDTRAGLLSFLMPGIGQLIQRRYKAALSVLFLTCVFWPLGWVVGNASFAQMGATVTGVGVALFLLANVLAAYDAVKPTRPAPLTPFYGRQMPKSLMVHWAVVVIVGLISLNIMIEASTPKNLNSGSIQMASAEKFDDIRQQRNKEAVAQFTADPAAVVAEIEKILQKNDYALAKQRLDMLGQIENADITRLRKKAEEIQKRAEAERERQSARAAAASEREQALISKALAKCKSAIAKHLFADGSGMIPDSANHANHIDPDEFYFAWSKGTFRLTTVFGTFDVSASCIGSLRRTKISWLTVNAKDVIVNGRKVE